MMPSLPASAKPWRAAFRVCDEETLIAGKANDFAFAVSSISAYFSGVATGMRGLLGRTRADVPNPSPRPPGRARAVGPQRLRGELVALAPPGTVAGQVGVLPDPAMHRDRGGRGGIDRPRRAELGDREGAVADLTCSVRETRSLLAEEE